MNCVFIDEEKITTLLQNEWFKTKYSEIKIQLGDLLINNVTIPQILNVKLNDLIDITDFDNPNSTYLFRKMDHEKIKNIINKEKTSQLAKILLNKIYNHTLKYSTLEKKTKDSYVNYVLALKNINAKEKFYLLSYVFDWRFNMSKKIIDNFLNPFVRFSDTYLKQEFVDSKLIEEMIYLCDDKKLLDKAKIIIAEKWNNNSKKILYSDLSNVGNLLFKHENFIYEKNNRLDIEFSIYLIDLMEKILINENSNSNELHKIREIKKFIEQDYLYTIPYELDIYIRENILNNNEIKKRLGYENNLLNFVQGGHVINSKFSVISSQDSIQSNEATIKSLICNQNNNSSDGCLKLNELEEITGTKNFNLKELKNLKLLSEKLLPKLESLYKNNFKNFENLLKFASFIPVITGNQKNKINQFLEIYNLNPHLKSIQIISDGIKNGVINTKLINKNGII